MRIFAKIRGNKGDDGPEIVELRTETSKTFDLGGGNRRLFAMMFPIHYKDAEGKFQDIDTAPYRDGDYWVVDRAPYVLKLGAEQPYFQFEVAEENVHVVGLSPVKTPIKFDGDRALWNVGGGVTLFVEIRPAAIKVGSILSSQEADQTLTWTINGKGVVYTEAMDAEKDPAELKEGVVTGRASKVIDPTTRQRRWVSALWPVEVI